MQNLPRTPLIPKPIAACVGYLLVSLALVAGRGTAQDRPAAVAATDLYDRVRPASLEVLVDDHLAGSAVVVDRSGLALTAAHLIGPPGSRVEALSPAAGRRTAKIVAVDLGHDLALMQLEPRPEGYPALPVAAEPPRAGEEIYLLGTPIYRHGVMLRGMVARNDDTFEFYRDHYVNIVHIAATVQMGTSGGPWFDSRGQLVGIQSGVMSSKEVPVGIAFAVPLPAMRKMLKTQRTACTASLGLAVEETWQQQRDVLKRFPPRTEGLVVKHLNPDGPGARAGMKQWDVIVAAADQTVRLPDELLRIVRGKAPGDTLSLTLLSPDGAGTRSATVCLGKLEVGWPPSAEDK